MGLIRFYFIVITKCNPVCLLEFPSWLGCWLIRFKWNTTSLRFGLKATPLHLKRTLKGESVTRLGQREIVGTHSKQPIPSWLILCASKVSTCSNSMREWRGNEKCNVILIPCWSRTLVMEWIYIEMQRELTPDLQGKAFFRLLQHFGCSTSYDYNNSHRKRGIPLV